MLHLIPCGSFYCFSSQFSWRHPAWPTSWSTSASVSRRRSVPAGSTSPLDVVVDGLAFDSAYGVTVAITINGARVSSADPAWRCSTSSSLIQCAAEELTAGPHPIHLDVSVPAAASSLTASAVVASIGSSDPVDANNTATVQSRVFDAGRCRQTLPQILATASDLQWTEVQGATSYEVYYGIDGETPHLASRTTDADATIDPPGGEVAWFVRARFDGCPPTNSARSSFQSHGAPMTLAVASRMRIFPLLAKLSPVAGHARPIDGGEVRRLGPREEDRQSNGDQGSAEKCEPGRPLLAA